MSAADATLLPPRLLGAEEVAEMLGESVHSIYRRARLGQVPAVRVGRSVKFDPGSIAAWIRAGGSPLDQDSA